MLLNRNLLLPWYRPAHLAERLSHRWRHDGQWLSQDELYRVPPNNFLQWAKCLLLCEVRTREAKWYTDDAASGARAGQHCVVSCQSGEGSLRWPFLLWWLMCH